MTPLPGQLPHVFSRPEAAHDYAQHTQGFKHDQYSIKKGPNGYHVIRAPGSYQRPRRAK